MSQGEFIYDQAKSQLGKPWYKVAYDPDLSKDKSKGSSIIYKKVTDETRLKASDPRLKSGFKDTFKSMKKYKKKNIPYKALSIPKFSYDKHSVGPPPTAEIVISGLGRAVSDIYLRNQLKTFGNLLEVDIILDPETGIPLGLLRVKFEGSIDKAARAAKNSVEALDKTKIDGNTIRVRLNKEGKVLEGIKSKILQSIRVQKKIHEIEEKKSSLPSAPKAVLNAISRHQIKKDIQLQQHQQPQHIKSPAAPASPSLPPLTIPKQPSIIKKPMEQIIKKPKVTIPQDLDKYIKGRSFIFLASKYIKNKISRNDVKKALETYEWTRVLDDDLGIFIVFNSPKEAKRCYQLENGKRVFTVNLFMELQLPDDYNPAEGDDDDYSNTQRDVIEEATSLLTKELEDALHKDIRTKIIAPAVLDFLNIDNFPEFKAKLQEKQRQQLQPLATSTVKVDNFINPMVKTNDDEDKGINVFSLQKTLPKLPSFKKKVHAGIKNEGNSVTSSPKKNKKLIRKQNKNLPLNYSLNFDEENESDYREASISTPQLEQSHHELISEPPKKKIKKNSIPETHELYSSSSDEEEEEDEEDEQLLLLTTKDSTPTTPEDDKMDVDVDVDISVKKLTKDEEEDVISNSIDKQLSAFDSLHEPTRTEYPIPVYEDDDYDVLLKKKHYFNINDLQSLIKDEEDLQLLKELYQDEMIDNPMSLDLNYWAWKQKNLIQESKELLSSGNSPSVPKSLQNSTGSHKTQGYVKIPDEVKVEYLPHRRRVHDPLSTIQVDHEENDSSKVQSSRANRSNNRRFAYEVSNFNTENEILTMNQLNKRKKPVSFARSAIHNWGLYALEPIAEREMIIEYVGERIRQQVAEFREKSYLKSGIGSSYLFRIDENTVIDATKKGGIARFINHCCVPSCTAKIIKVEGEKRIVIYALRDIATNEELTYDYKFERETNDDERVRCLCGVPGCKGYLN